MTSASNEKIASEHRMEVAAVQNSLAHMSMPHQHEFSFDAPKPNGRHLVANGADRPKQPRVNVSVTVLIHRHECICGLLFLALARLAAISQDMHLQRALLTCVLCVMHLNASEHRQLLTGYGSLCPYACLAFALHVLHLGPAGAINLTLQMM